MARCSDPRKRSAPARRVALVVFGCLVVPVTLLLLEGLLAAFGVAPNRFDDPYIGFESTTDLFSLEELDGDRRVFSTAPNKLQFFNHQEFPEIKADGTYRIFCLGGSTTAGRPYDDRVSFPRWLERYLDAAEPDRRHEVINAGAISYASYRVVLLMKELVRYSPDLFVVYTGHNEFLEERTYRSFIHQSPALKWLRSRFLRYRIARLATQAFARRDPDSESESRLEAEVQTRLDVWTGIEGFRRDDELRRAIVEHFAFNLDQMAAIARAYDVPLMLVEPISNLKDFSPFKSEHGSSVDPADRRRFQSLLSKGRDSLVQERHTEALDLFGEAERLDSAYAEVHFQTGRALLALGNSTAAKEAFIRAKDLDIAPLRALERISELVREKAGSWDLPLIELRTLLEAESQTRFAHTILGNEYLLDHVHPNMTVHSQIAERILATLADLGEIRLSNWSGEKRISIYETTVDRLDRDYYAQRDLNLGKVLGWAGKLEESEAPLLRAAEHLRGNLDLHLSLGTLWQKTNRLEDAVRELEEAGRLAPEVPEVHFNLGVVMGRLGRLDEGIAALREALRLRPDYGEAQHNLGVLYREAGESGAAVAAMERAAELAPASAEVAHARGLAYRQAGRIDDALDAFHRTLELDPEHALAHSNRGILLARSQRIDEAFEHLQRATEIEPTNAAFHFNLGVALDLAARPLEAMQAIETAIRLDPTDPRKHLALAMLYNGHGRPEDALHHFETARRGGQPVPPEIERQLAR